MGQITVVVGVIKHPNPNDQDAVDKGVESGKQYDVKSKSAADFFNGVKNEFDKHRRTQDDCCIKHLVIDCHSTAALGGGEGLDKLTPAQIQQLKDMLCRGAKITVLGCFAFNLNLFPQYRLHLDLAMLLTEKGGTYEGYKSITRGFYPDVKSDDPKEKKPTTADIPRGASEDDVKKKFKEIYPTGQ